MTKKFEQTINDLVELEVQLRLAEISFRDKQNRVRELRAQLSMDVGDGGAEKRGGKRNLSPEARALIAAATKRRWARYRKAKREGKDPGWSPGRKQRVLTPKARKAMAKGGEIRIDQEVEEG